MNSSLSQTAEGLERARYAPLKHAVEALAAVCDGAVARDHVGYDGSDAPFGHLLAFLDLDEWAPTAFYRAWRMLRKYRMQLARAGIAYDELPEPPCLEGQDRYISLHAPGEFLVIFPYNDGLIAAFRHIPGGEVRTKPVRHRIVRTVPGAGQALLSFADRYRFQCAPGVREHAEQLSTDHYVTLDPVRADAFAVYFPRDAALNAEIKAIPGWTCSYQPAFRWIIPARLETLRALHLFLSRHHEFVLTPEAERRLQEAGTSLTIRNLLR